MATVNQQIHHNISHCINANNNTNNATNEDLIVKYDDLMRRYMNSMSESHIFFEISKCCGYSQIVTTYRNGTLRELYDSFAYHFELILPSLCAIKEENGITNVLEIPNDDTKIRDFVQNNHSFFKAVYPIPARVVYKIFFTTISCGCSQSATPQLAPVAPVAPVI